MLNAQKTYKNFDFNANSESIKPLSNEAIQARTDYLNQKFGPSKVQFLNLTADLIGKHQTEDAVSRKLSNSDLNITLSSLLDFSLNLEWVKNKYPTIDLKANSPHLCCAKEIAGQMVKARESMKDGEIKCILAKIEKDGGHGFPIFFNKDAALIYHWGRDEAVMGARLKEVLNAEQQNSHILLMKEILHKSKYGCITLSLELAKLFIKYEADINKILLECSKEEKSKITVADLQKHNPKLAEKFLSYSQNTELLSEENKSKLTQKGLLNLDYVKKADPNWQQKHGVDTPDEYSGPEKWRAYNQDKAKYGEDRESPRNWTLAYKQLKFTENAEQSNQR
jgi:hypothetical protein